ncbi:MAG: creatininase family protein [Gemmatimonadetes bacterium]|jgi:creatinine amidohydrolase|nr:creatininase family protein [Gemmatimonadota bacterium]MBT6146100.1 creatininase family protein [Gemmatimonadota bacterium]MBT7863527.1 creatininase family protein [Gemmatimonadota bacterium]
MRWEHLTYPDFEKAIDACDGVGIIPMGVIEPHGAHLPLGTDTLAAHTIASQAAEQEPAIVFPQYPWGINHEGAHLPGSIVVQRDLVLQLLQNVCDEMARHGCKKIVITSGHGGNRYLIPLFVQTLVERDVDYLVYAANPVSSNAWVDLMETDERGHACEYETSLMLALEPEHVKMADIPEPFTSNRGNAELKKVGAYSPMDWYAMYPNMYVGDASKATAEKGKAILEAEIDGLVTLLRAVKQDTITPALNETFRKGANSPSSPY